MQNPGVYNAQNMKSRTLAGTRGQLPCIIYEDRVPFATLFYGHPLVYAQAGPFGNAMSANKCTPTNTHIHTRTTPTHNTHKHPHTHTHRVEKHQCFCPFCSSTYSSTFAAKECTITSDSCALLQLVWASFTPAAGAAAAHASTSNQQATVKIKHSPSLTHTFHQPSHHG